jgi:hypothetical protein
MSGPPHDIPSMIGTGASTNGRASPLPGARTREAGRLRSHVLSRIQETEVGRDPFYHLFIERIFPPDFYEAIRAHMLECKSSRQLQDRNQDSTAFTNKRYNLFASEDELAARLRALFSDPDVKLALLRKFFVSPSRELADALSIHEEFEYFFTKAGRVQNIHLDIPPKFLSFVFYIPSEPMTAEQAERNATILYDKSLVPHYRARFEANSVCVFAPHFSTYHGFSSTLDRDVLVLFYVNGAELLTWRRVRQEGKDEPPFSGLLDCIERKLRLYPLLEFDGEEGKLARERAACLVNAPQGRVLRPDQVAR